MWKDICVILFVIGVSYIFTVSETKKFDKQMMFILLTLTIIILYKIVHYKNGVSEGFININASEISEWLSNASSNDGSDSIATGELSTKADDINEKLSKTIEEVGKLKDILLEREKIDRNTEDDYLSSLDTRNMQTMQNKELQKLQTDIENAKTMLSQIEIVKSTKKYPKIPVYSSCVISNADGTYNLDSPDTTKDMQSKQPTVAGDTNQNAVLNGGQSQQQEGVAMLNQMLSNILQNGVNLNFA